MTKKFKLRPERENRDFDFLAFWGLYVHPWKTMSLFIFEDIFSIFGTSDLFEKCPWELEALFTEFLEQ